jgi:hypothetical protein
MEMASHPYADLFPMMTAAEQDALAADIAANGLRQPVVRYQGKVLDGRNRLAACKKAGVAPTFTDHEGDDASALALVISLNVQRRDMTAAQRAIVAARSLPMFEAAAKQRQGKKTSATNSGRPRRATDDASKVFKVGVNAVQQAKALLIDAPDLAQQVEACVFSVAAAYQQLQQRQERQRQEAKDAERTAAYRDAVSSGEMTLDEALQKTREEEREEKERAEHDASARRLWFDGLASLLRWCEDCCSSRTDEHLAWYTQPGELGVTNHAVTADRLAAAIAELERVRTITFAVRP